MIDGTHSKIELIAQYADKKGSAVVFNEGTVNECCLKFGDITSASYYKDCFLKVELFQGQFTVDIWGKVFAIEQAFEYMRVAGVTCWEKPPIKVDFDVYDDTGDEEEDTPSIECQVLEPGKDQDILTELFQEDE